MMDLQTLIQKANLKSKIRPDVTFQGLPLFESTSVSLVTIPRIFQLLKVIDKKIVKSITCSSQEILSGPLTSKVLAKQLLKSIFSPKMGP